MAIFTPGPPIGAISGNLAALNFVQTRYGPVVRRRLHRLNKQTAPQLASRARTVRVLREWATLTEPQRLSWVSVASQTTFPNQLGMYRHLSGFQLFCHCWFGLPETTAIWPLAPDYMIRGNPPTDIVLSASAGGAVSVAFTITSPPAHPFVLFHGARSVSSRPHHHFKNWRYLLINQFLPGARNQVLTAEWDAALGHPLEGELIAIKMFTDHRTHLRSFFTDDTAITAA